MNKPIYFGGLSGKKFDWNIALNYSFDFNFIEKPKKKLIIDNPLI
jgi:hypothetical protein